MSESGSAPPRLTPNQANAVSSRLAHVDDLLRRIDGIVRSRGSPFTREQSDLSETEAALLEAFIDTARERLLSALDRLGLPRPTPTLSARWSAASTLRFADIALSELTPESLRGYGRVDPAVAGELAAIGAALRDVVDRGMRVLQPDEGEGLANRLAGVPNLVGEFLRGAEAISRTHGLVEVRPLIAAAADRLETATVDVGVFGRVSSGKSSLINALVGEPVLPVGATPVTAVPLRVSGGAPSIAVTYLDGQREHIERARLGELATEAGNPENRRRVRSIEIRSGAVPAGLAFLDTPGVGSLNQSGAAQTYAFLPRCDIGLVLVAAGTPLGRDEMALVSALVHAGIDVEVLLSKGDLLGAEDRAAAVGYVSRVLAQELRGALIDVRVVSSAADGGALLERWREDALLPRIAARHADSRAALQRRLRALLAAMNASMIGRGGLRDGAIQLQAVRLAATERIEMIVEALERAARDAIPGATSAIVGAWRSGESAIAAARRALAEPAARALAAAREAADSMVVTTDDPNDVVAGNRIPPLFDPAVLDALPVHDAPSLFDRAMPDHAARQQLGAVEHDLQAAYSRFAGRVRAWALERLRENTERAAATAAGDAGALAPELRPLAELLDRHLASAAASAHAVEHRSETRPS